MRDQRSNDHNKYAVAVKNESGQIVGHVPIEISKTMCKFICDCGEVEVECIGHQYNVGQGKGLKIPVDYRLLGNQQCLQRVVTKLKSTDLALSISDIRKIMWHRVTEYRMHQCLFFDLELDRETTSII